MQKQICAGNVVSRFPIRRFAPAGIVWLGMLCASCQPILPDEGLHPHMPAHDVEQSGQAPLPERLNVAAPRPVPCLFRGEGLAP